MSSFPCLVRTVTGAGEVRYSLDHERAQAARAPNVPISPARGVWAGMVAFL
jgi:hypothetical protein